MDLNKTKAGLIINVRKPLGWTSFDVVRYIKKRAGNLKIGHAGTLDPFAEGVLLICLGSATKRVSDLMDKDKQYETVIQLGMETDTLDMSGTLTEQVIHTPVPMERIQHVLSTYVGEIKQKPPAYSAVKVAGKRAYEYARKGQKVQLKTKKIKIHAIELDAYQNDQLHFSVTCSKGTYVRALARDIASDLETRGYIRKLVRKRIGSYRLEDSIEIQNVFDLPDLLSMDEIG